MDKELIEKFIDARYGMEQAAVFFVQTASDALVKLWFKHYRYVAGQEGKLARYSTNDLHFTPTTNGGKVVAYIKGRYGCGERVYSGESVCSKEDVFDKAEGTSIAFARAVYGYYLATTDTITHRELSYLEAKILSAEIGHWMHSLVLGQAGDPTLLYGESVDADESLVEDEIPF